MAGIWAPRMDKRAALRSRALEKLSAGPWAMDMLEHWATRPVGWAVHQVPAHAVVSFPSHQAAATLPTILKSDDASGLAHLDLMMALDNLNSQYWPFLRMLHYLFFGFS